MNHPDSVPPPPAMPELSWRALADDDVAAITALSAAGLAVDGGLPLAATDDFVKERYLEGQPNATIGATDDGRLAACAAVQLQAPAQEHRARIVGQVHPAYRRRGIGTFLLGWSIAQGRALLRTRPHDRPHTLLITTESLTEAAAQLYERHGFTQQFAEDVMRRDLHTPLPNAAFPAGITLATWTLTLAEQFFDVYQAAFRERPGYPGWSAKEWIAWLTGDDAFHPELSLLARHGELPVGFIACAANWIVQVGVRPSWRGRGLAAALVVAALRRFQAAGHDQVLLDVNVNNPSAARVYARLGFEVVGRRARYALTLA